MKNVRDDEDKTLLDTVMKKLTEQHPDYEFIITAYNIKKKILSTRIAESLTLEEAARMMHYAMMNMVQAMPRERAMLFMLEMLAASHERTKAAEEKRNNKEH